MTNTPQPQDKEDRLREGDKPIFSIGGWSFTTNEWHAIILGLSTGTVLGLQYQHQPTLTSTIAVGMVLLSVGLHGYITNKLGDECSPKKTIAYKTIQHEAWYYAPIMVLSLIIANQFL